MLASNTSTLVLLAKVDCLEIFMESSPKIEIPDEVRVEALFHEETYYARLIKKLIQENKIKVNKVDTIKTREIMKDFRLDLGEAATYIMYDKKRHKAILTDDGELIKLCKLEGIPFICAMAVIIKLYEDNKLTKDETMIKLNKLNEIGRYSKNLYEYFIKLLK